MLNTLRKGAKSWVAKGLFFLLILSFGAWGIGDYLRPDPAAPAAEVGDLAISRDELNRDFNRQLEQLRQRFGNAIDRETAARLGLVDQALNQAIDRRLLELEARELGVRVSDDIVRDRILQEPAFTTATGEFNRVRFEQTLFNNGLTEEGFVAMMRGDLARGMVADTVTAGAEIPANVARLIYADEAETRSVELVVLPDTAADQPPEPTDAQLAETFETDKQRWMAPEYRSAVAVLLRPEDLMGEVPVDEGRIREAYEARKAQFETPGTRDVSQLLFSDEAAAAAASKRIADGESFDAVAADLAGKGADRTDIGTVTKDDLFPAEVADAAFALDAAGATQPVRSPLGWHLLHVTDIKPGSVTPLAEVRDRIRDDIAREGAVDRIYGVGTEIDDALAGGASVEDVAGQFGLPLVELPPVSRQGVTQSGAPPAEMPTVRGLLDTVFQTSAGSASRLVETPEGAYYVVRVKDVIEARQRPLDEVREQVAERWRAAERHRMAEAKAKALAEQVRGGTALSAAAGEAGLTVETPPAVRRSTNASDMNLPPALVAKVFAAKQGDVLVEALPGGYAIAQLSKIDKVDPAAESAEVAGVRDQLSQGMAADIRAQYLQALRARYGVTINPTVVQSLF